MRIIMSSFALAFVSATSVCAQDLSQQQIEGIQAAVRDADCTVEDTGIKAKDYGYKAKGAVCKDGTYDIKLDKDFKITEKQQPKPRQPKPE